MNVADPVSRNPSLLTTAAPLYLHCVLMPPIQAKGYLLHRVRHPSRLECHRFDQLMCTEASAAAIVRDHHSECPDLADSTPLASRTGRDDGPPSMESGSPSNQFQAGSAVLHASIGAGTPRSQFQVGSDMPSDPIGAGTPSSQFHAGTDRPPVSTGAGTSMAGIEVADGDANPASTAADASELSLVDRIRNSYASDSSFRC